MRPSVTNWYRPDRTKISALWVRHIPPPPTSTHPSKENTQGSQGVVPRWCRRPRSRPAGSAAQSPCSHPRTSSRRCRTLPCTDQAQALVRPHCGHYACDGEGVVVNLQPVFQPAGMARLFKAEGLYSTAVPSLPVKNSSDITEAVPEGASGGRVRQRERENAREPNEPSPARGGGTERPRTSGSERACSAVGPGAVTLGAGDAGTLRILAVQAGGAVGTAGGTAGKRRASGADQDGVQMGLPLPVLQAGDVALADARLGWPPPPDTLAGHTTGEHLSRGSNLPPLADADQSVPRGKEEGKTW